MPLEPGRPTPSRTQNVATPLVLVDEPADGVCETRGWVETTVPEDRARSLLARFCCDEDGQSPFTPTGPARKVMLAPDEGEYVGEVAWYPAASDAEDAREFWEVVVA